MKLTHTAAAAFIAIAAAAAPTMTFAQTCCAPVGNDWPEVNGNLGAWQYSSLTQIDKSNINNLGPAWVVHVSAEPITAPVAPSSAITPPAGVSTYMTPSTTIGAGSWLAVELSAGAATGAVIGSVPT